MSILIKGMEMPTSCEYCPFHKSWPFDDEVQCIINKDLWHEGDGRHSECPLVEVSPHGRLIDADALVRDNGIKEIPEYYEVVRDAPTIIEAEEE